MSERSEPTPDTAEPLAGSGPMDAATEAFLAHRNLLFTVAYELLGSAADAEDVLQETWLRWVGVDLDTVQDQRATWSGSPPAWRSTGCERSAAARSPTSAPGCPSRC
jgi:Sigma-70 region 2